MISDRRKCTDGAKKMTEARYIKNIGILGEEGQNRLFDSHVAIAGAGGLGGTVFEILVRYGVGRITIIDFGSFEESNLNRQLLSSVKLLGKNKASAAVKRANEINPDVKVLAHGERITDENARVLIGGAHLVCDCLGNIRDRFVLERAARALSIPMVHAAVAGQRGQLATIFPGDVGLSAIYGEEKSAPASGDEITLGTPPSTVMAVAAMQAHETVRLLIGEPPHPAALRNELLVVDINKWEFSHYQLPQKTA